MYHAGRLCRRSLRLQPCTAVELYRGTLQHRQSRGCSIAKGMGSLRAASTFPFSNRDAVATRGLALHLDCLAAHFTTNAKGGGRHTDKKNVSSKSLEGAQFASLPIDSSLKETIAQVLKYDEMSRCQAMSIPVALQGVDMLTKVCQLKLQILLEFPFPYFL